MDEYVQIVRAIREQVEADLRREREEGPQDAGWYSAELNEGGTVTWPIAADGRAHGS